MYAIRFLQEMLRIKGIYNCVVYMCVSIGICHVYSYPLVILIIYEVWKHNLNFVTQNVFCGSHEKFRT